MQLLFHSDVFMPNGVQEVCRNAQKRLDKYELSFHLKQHLQERENRSHNYLTNLIEKCLKMAVNEHIDCFEVELTKGKKGWFVSKYCFRVKYSATEDGAIVVRPNNGQNLIATAWLNNINDDHKTLDKSKYTTKEEWLRLR